MSRPPKYNIFVFVTVRFVVIEETLQVTNSRVNLKSHNYPDYESFFESVVALARFHYDPARWTRFQAILDYGSGTPKVPYDRDHPGPIVIPEDRLPMIVFFNRTMSVPVHLRLGEAWQPTSTEMWTIPGDVEMTVRDLKEYLMTGKFQIEPESLLHKMRMVRSNHLSDGQFQEALDQNSELSTFSLSLQYEGTEVSFPPNREKIVTMYSYQSPKHAAPHFVFTVIPVSYW
jgi:hypothetical protein